MKKRSLLLGLISLILAFPAKGQIVTKYEQGFEASGETYGYTVVQGSAIPVSNVASSGSRSLKMVHSQNGIVEIMLDTLDFTDNGSFQHFYLEFMHICDVNPLMCADQSTVATIEARLIGEQQWVTLNGSDYYDVTWGGGTSSFVSLSSFSERSYTVWQGTNINGTWWKRERFKLGLRISSAQLADRKLLIRFRLRGRTAAGASDEGWYLDNIKVQCSPNSMLLPVMKMLDYPDLGRYPNSRGTRLAAEFTTPLTQGMCNDSVYVEYQLGSISPILRKTMTPMSSGTGRYETYLPFCGYDTIVRWRIVGKDNSVNHNQTNFPEDVNAWQQYVNVRGKDMNAKMSPADFAPSNSVPFPNMGDFKMEMVYDSSEMAQGGFGPGAITQIRFPVASNVNNSFTRFAVLMHNVDNSFSYTGANGNYNFSSEFQKVVYDSSLHVIQNNGTYGTINLQDTFFYAGKGLMVTFINDNVAGDNGAINVRTFPAQPNTNTGSISMAYNASYGMDPFNSSYFQSGNLGVTRPNFTLKVNPNAPLLHDCGISGFINPNDTTPANAVGNNDVIVTLKNYGALPINSVRIYYSVDNGAHQYYDWSGTLAGGATTNVTISSTQQYAAGYHEMLAWVDDSVLSAGVRYRDHEPFNDTLWTKFISCDGPMSGVRTVGGSTPDYASLEKMLYALSQCGVNGPLVVKLAPGYYTPHTFPSIPGISANNYVQFEPLSGSVTFVSAMADTAWVNSLVNLQQTHHVRFKNINFFANAASNPATYLVRMGTNSKGCQFLDCTFGEVQGGSLAESYMAATALLYSGGADSLLVKGCTFNRGTAGLSLVGPATDNMARGSRVIGNSFSHQGVNSAIIRNQIDVEVDSNTCDDLYANSSYAILLQDCSGATKVTRNTVYVSSGASCIGATELIGSPSGYAVVANNMLISNDDGLSNMLTTPLNIITANYAKILYNSIKLTAPTRSGIAAATFGGGTLQNSYFYNNIVGCYDTVNFAFNYIPTGGATNYIGYNIYYSRGPVLNKYDGINCLSFANWQTHCTMDGNSQNVNPAFLNITPTDLRSYSQNVKSHGVPIDEVQIDIFGTERDSVAPCIGAFEFSALPYDFEILEFIEPYDEYCVAPSAAPLRVVIKNSGVNAYDPSAVTTPMQLSYSRSTAPGVMAPGASGNVIINTPIPALDTIVFNTGVTVPFPTVGTDDTTYRFYAWLTTAQLDPNPANDTNSMLVTSHYHAPAPDSISVNVDYGTAATVTANGGLQTWYSNVYTSSASHKSSVYWYTSLDSDSAIWRGNTFTTDPLYTDTTFYIRQKRDYPLVKITEVQLKQNAPGVTYPMPLWMHASTTLAIELTNIGDYPANLMDDTIKVVSSTNSYNNKIYRFPNLTIQPGQSVVLQYRNGINNVDSSKTIATSYTLAPPQSANLGIAYISGGLVRDAVAINDITTQTAWANLNVPNNIWYGEGISLPDSIPTAGIYRTAWPSPTASFSNTTNRWQRSDDNNRMTMGTTNTNLIRFYDNGCIGDAAPVRIHMINLPDVDIALEGLSLQDGCGMGATPITITVHNRGAQPSGQTILNYRVVGYPQYAGQAQALQVCSDTIAAGFAPGSTTTHTFSAVPDFTVNSASVDFDVLVWTEKITADIASFNDTLRLSLTSLFMPDSANVRRWDTVSYNTRAILQSLTPPTDSLAWYDRDMNILDTTNVYVTDYIYEPDTFYVSTFGARVNTIHVGNMSSLTNANNYPSPYNPKKKYIKEQYIYLASELTNAGHGAGPIQTVAFYLDTILSPEGTFAFTDYTISMGTTTQANFTNQSNWQTVTQNYVADTLTLSNSSKGWITHNLNNAFHWNGTDNIVVQVTRSIDPAVSQGARTRYTSSSNRVLVKNGDDSSLVNFVGNGNRGNNRPDVQFGFVDYGCESEPLPVYLAVVNVPASDAAISWSADDTVAYTSCDSTDINIQLRNLGGVAFTSYTIDCWIDDSYHSVFTGSDSVPANGGSVVKTVDRYHFTPGRHVLRMAVTQATDTVQTNDTISRMINVRFCGGSYTIGPANGLYADFTTAIDTLTNAGIDGSVEFYVENGTYQEQVTLGAVDGVSATNKISFIGDTTNPSNVTLRYAPVNGNNYVLHIDNSNFVNFKGITVLARGASNYSNAVLIENSNQIRFKEMVVRVKGTLNNVNASGIVLGNGVQAFYMDSSTVDSGYYSIRSIVDMGGASNGVYLNNNSFVNFTNTGLYLRKIDEVYISHNEVHTGANAARPLTGIVVAEHNGAAVIERNNIVISDNYKGAKVGIKLINVNGANATRTRVSNNFCAMNGNDHSGSVGIWIDSSTWVNAYYNTANVFAGNGTAGSNTSAMKVTTTSFNVYVMNNILSNQSAGYSFYVQMAANITNSNYNNYWSSSETRLFYWGGNEVGNMTDLRTINHLDNNSLNLKPFYESVTDLHLSLGTFCEKAQYNTEVPLDIDGYIRPQIPSPCMGAHEFIRKTHNIAVQEIHEPGIKIYATQTTGFTDNIEGDTLWVKVTLFNDGTSTESNLTWWAEIKDVTPILRSTNHYIDELLPQGSVTDSNYIVMPLGVIDTQIVVIHFPMANDSAQSNNILEGKCFLDPAYNLRAEASQADMGDGCRRQNTVVGVQLTNVGRKTFTAGTMVPVGFQAVLQTSGITVSTLPISFQETLPLPVDVEPNASVTLTFNQTANLYPTGNDKDIVVQTRAWSAYQYDLKPLNDTSAFESRQSYYTPNSPVGEDLHIPYATWDTIFATQTDNPPTGAAIHRSILWYRDSTMDPFHTGNNYNLSRWWETPQYFHDSVYFLSCVSNHGCTSYYSPVHVYLNPRVAVDMAVLDVVEPVGTRVYMTNDSVKLALINYGTQTITNIPVVYELYSANNTLLQHVQEICTASIAPDSVYVFRFDSLLSIPSWSTTQAYKLRVWTDMPNENVRLNDTLRNISVFYAVPDSYYPAIVPENKPGLDITRVAFSSLDNTVSPAGHDYINFTNANSQSGVISDPSTILDYIPDYGGKLDVQSIGSLRALHLVKGTQDTMIVECRNSDRANDFGTTGWLSVWIDVDRDGQFKYEPLTQTIDGVDTVYDGYPFTEVIYQDTITSGIPLKFPFSLPADVRTGYMRMRVVLDQGSTKIKDPTAGFQFGCIQDYLLYVEDVPVEDVDLCASRIVSPRSQFIGGNTGYTADSAVTVSFQIANKGRQPVTSAEINYTYINDRSAIETATLQWSGNIEPGQSAVVDLPSRVFATGTTDVIIGVSTFGDTNTINDTLLYQYYRAPIKRLIFADDFEGANDWFIPRGYTAYDQNLWQRGKTTKPNIMACVSDSNILSTNVNGFINTFNTGNVSYVYTPIFDISTIRPDTLDLWVARDMAHGHLCRIEFCDYLGRWQVIGSGNDTLWYNSGAGWDSVSPGYGYSLCRFSLTPLGGDFQQRLQFRLAYKAETGTEPCDGIAIDDFVVGRAVRPIDAMVIAITYPTEPRFGQVIKPRVVVKNNGLDTLYEFQVAYLPYGVNLARTGIYHNDAGLLPGATDIFEFPTPFTVKNDFPDTFQICAYTMINMDMYRDNDTVCQEFYLTPLDNDMGAISFNSPLDHCIAGDSIIVDIRMRNYGQAPVQSASVTYIYNETYRVTEDVNFVDMIGHELESFEYVNYSFKSKFRSSMGMMDLMAIVHMDNDDYPFNDTIRMRIEGLSAITDLRARASVVDSSDQNATRIQVIVDNVGARAVNDFKIGFWYYNDTSTLIDTIYHGETPLPALRSLYFRFPNPLPRHSEYYKYVTAFVYTDDDNDRSNDTTTLIEPRYLDLRPIRVLIEENREDSCRVRMEVENIGNTTSRSDQPFRANLVINGASITVRGIRRDIMPGYFATIEVPTKVLKSPTRTYVGSVTLDVADDNADNNQTTRVEVINYFEGIPFVSEKDGMVLHQNYPNPFDNTTRIDFRLPNSGDVRFFVMDELGRLVYQEQRTFAAGDQSITFGQEKLASGVYYYGIEMDGRRLMRKMVLKR